MVTLSRQGVKFGTSTYVSFERAKEQYIGLWDTRRHSWDDYKKTAIDRATMILLAVMTNDDFASMMIS